MFDRLFIQIFTPDMLSFAATQVGSLQDPLSRIPKGKALE
jgi:hypothetical protein